MAARLVDGQREVGGVVSPSSDDFGSAVEDIIGKGGNEGQFFLVKNNTGVSFGMFIGSDTIVSATGTEFADLVAGDTVRVTGSDDNDGDFTVSSVDLAGARILVSESATVEAAGASITIIRV